VSAVDVLAVLGEVEDYFADRSDVVDGDYGQPEANAEMILLQEFGDAREAVAGVVEALRKMTDMLEAEVIGTMWPYKSEIYAEARAALARCKGETA